MPRDGNGTYNAPEAPVATNTPISSTSYNASLTDIGNALTQSLSADGQTVPTANLPMGTYRHTNVSNGTARNQYAALGQVQDAAVLWGGTAGGTANARTITLTPAIPAYAAGQVFRFLNGAAANTTTDPTLAVNGLAARMVKSATGGLIPPGALAANGVIQVVDDGTNWRLLNIPSLSASVALLGVQTIATSLTTSISFDTEENDPLQAFVIGTANRMTVPAGVSRVALRASVRWGVAPSGARFAQIRQNGTTLVASDLRPGSDSSGSHQSCLGEVAVSAGDFFELRVTHDSGANLNVIYAQMTMAVVA